MRSLIRRPGDIDTSFVQSCASGLRNTDPFGHFEGHAVAIQDDGRILIAGSRRDGPDRLMNFAVVRLHVDGRLDDTFGQHGWKLLDVSDDDDHANAIALQADGKILIAGRASGNSSHSFDFAVVRLNGDGSVDKSFGDDGMVVTDFSGGSHDTAHAITVQKDGNIIVVGYAAIFGDAPTEDFALVRYRPDGSLDTTFGQDGSGKIVMQLNGTFERAYAMAVQPYGRRIIVAGVTGDDTATRAVLVGYAPDGIVDVTFGDNGIISSDFGGSHAGIYGIDVDTEGRVAAVGYVSAGDRQQWAITRYTADGSPDVDFNEGRVLVTDFADAVSTAYSVASKSRTWFDDYGIVVSGHVGPSLAVASFDAAGNLDSTFANQGLAKRVFRDGEHSAVAYAVALQRDGGIVTAGTSVAGTRLALARFHASSGHDSVQPVEGREQAILAEAVAAGGVLGDPSYSSQGAQIAIAYHLSEVALKSARLYESYVQAGWDEENQIFRSVLDWGMRRALAIVVRALHAEGRPSAELLELAEGAYRLIRLNQGDLEGHFQILHDVTRDMTTYDSVAVNSAIERLSAYPQYLEMTMSEFVSSSYALASAICTADGTLSEPEAEFLNSFRDQLNELLSTESLKALSVTALSIYETIEPGQVEDLETWVVHRGPRRHVVTFD